jgi:hypothetical protein
MIEKEYQEREEDRKARRMKLRRTLAQRRQDVAQEAFDKGVRRGVQKERRVAQKAREQFEKYRKSHSSKTRKIWGHRLRVARREAFFKGIDFGSRQERTKQSKTAGAKPAQTIEPALKKRRWSKVAHLSADQIAAACSSAACEGLGATPTKAREDHDFSSLLSDEAPVVPRATSKGSRQGVHALSGCPTPLRSVALAPQRSNALVGDERAMFLASCPPADASAFFEHAELLRSVPSGVHSANALRAFLKNPAGVAREPAAFQLRCTLQRAGKDSTAKTIVFITSGKCSLWKLNQIVAECFGGTAQKFAYEANQGAIVPGSYFAVSRPLEPGQCNKAMLSSNSTASSRSGRDPAFIDDRSSTVAMLFRGTSTGLSLERDAHEAAQLVSFSSPSIGADVIISLDGTMLDSYDSRDIYDKNRRYGNGRKTLPRIVCSSFLGATEIEKMNITFQGSRYPEFLSRFDSTWSAIHASCRRSQRMPLFHSDGADFDPNSCPSSED